MAAWQVDSGERGLGSQFGVAKQLGWAGFAFEKVGAATVGIGDQTWPVVSAMSSRGVDAPCFWRGYQWLALAPWDAACLFARSHCDDVAGALLFEGAALRLVGGGLSKKLKSEVLMMAKKVAKAPVKKAAAKKPAAKKAAAAPAKKVAAKSTGDNAKYEQSGAPWWKRISLPMPK